MKTLDHCPICGSSRVRHAYSTGDLEFHTTADTYHFWRCSGCGSYFQNPMPEEAELPAFYSFPQQSDYGAYSQVTLPPLSRWQARLLAKPVRGARHRRGLVAGVDNRVLELRRVFDAAGGTLPARVLDVGCGSGFMLLMLIRDLGLKPEGMLGIDIDDGAEARGRAVGLRFRRATLGELEESGFDLIVLSHVLEHVPDPRRFLEQVAGKLAPGGRVLLSVPNGRSLPARIMGRRWVCHSVPRHLFNFSRQGLLTLCRGLFVCEAASSAGIYTFMFSRYYSRWFARAMRLASPLLAIGSALISLAGAGDNQSLVLRKAA